MLRLRFTGHGSRLSSGTDGHPRREESRAVNVSLLLTASEKNLASLHNINHRINPKATLEPGEHNAVRLLYFEARKCARPAPGELQSRPMKRRSLRAGSGLGEPRQPPCLAAGGAHPRATGIGASAAPESRGRVRGLAAAAGAGLARSRGGVAGGGDGGDWPWGRGGD